MEHLNEKDKEMKIKQYLSLVFIRFFCSKQQMQIKA